MTENESFIKDFEITLIEKCKLKKNYKVLLSLSYGVDSQLMFELFLRLKNTLNIEIAVFHLEHMYRSSSFNEMQKLKEKTKKHNVEFFCYRRNIAKIAKHKKESFELVARNTRKSFIETIFNEGKFDYIATAHHLDDHAESVLLHLTRGSSIKGLIAMDFLQGNLIRPLMFLDKEEIYENAKKFSIDYIEDSSNKDTKFARNKIRNKVLPVLKEINQNFSRQVFKNSRLLETDANFINYELGKIKKKTMRENFFQREILINKFKDFDISLQSRLVYSVLEELRETKRDIYKSEIDEIIDLILNARSSKIHKRENYVFEKRKNICAIYKLRDKNETEQALKLGINSFNSQVFIVEEINCTIEKPNEILIEPSRLKNLKLRTRREKDYIRLKNLDGRKSIKKLLNDLNLSLNIRDNIALIADGNEIIWLPHYRKSKRQLKNSGKTEKMIRIKADFQH